MDGIYRVRFSTGGAVEAMAVINHGSFKGGDSTYLFLGTLEVKDRLIRGTLRIRRRRSAEVATPRFREVDGLKLALSGLVNQRGEPSCVLLESCASRPIAFRCLASVFVRRMEPGTPRAFEQAGRALQDGSRLCRRSRSRFGDVAWNNPTKSRTVVLKPVDLLSSQLAR